MKFPSNPDFYVKLLLALVIVLGAVFLQAQTGSLPDWLIIAFGAVISFFFGVSTTPHSPGNNSKGGS